MEGDRTSLPDKCTYTAGIPEPYTYAQNWAKHILIGD